MAAADRPKLTRVTEADAGPETICVRQREDRVSAFEESLYSRVMQGCSRSLCYTANSLMRKLAMEVASLMRCYLPAWPFGSRALCLTIAATVFGIAAVVYVLFLLFNLAPKLLTMRYQSPTGSVDKTVYENLDHSLTEDRVYQLASRCPRGYLPALLAWCTA